MTMRKDTLHEVTARAFGNTPEGEATLIRIVNRSGNYVELTDYGARVVSIVIKDASGTERHVALGFPFAEHYQRDDNYIGATIGRIANRISGSSFMLDGIRYMLEQNDGENSNHGGLRGFDRRLFRFGSDGEKVRFLLRSNDGEGGYPGNIDIAVTYGFTDNNELTILYEAVADSTTVLNLTNHTYFNLSGGESSAIDAELTLRAAKYAGSGTGYIPTGKLHKVRRTRFDFTATAHIASRVNDSTHPYPLHGFNEYYIIDSQGASDPVAILSDRLSGISMEVRTTYPGLFFYTGDYLTSGDKGIHGRCYLPYDGICLEAQLYPDAVNRPEFPGITLEAGETYSHSVSYRFLIL